MPQRCVIIGSGLAGSVLANALADDADVTVLEAGPEHGVRYPDVQFPSRELAAIKTFCHARGGTTNLWHNGLIPLRPGDVTDPAFRAVLEDAATWTDAAAQMLHFPEPSYSETFAALLDEVAEIAAGIGDFPLGVDTLVYPKSIAPLAPPTRARSVYDVSDLGVEVSDGRVRSVSWQSGGERHTLETDRLVIAAGAFGTPGVLAKVIAACGLNDNALGQGLVDHPMGFVGKFRFPAPIAALAEQFGLLDKGPIECRSMFRLQSDDGKLKGCAYLRPCLSMNNSLSIYQYKSLLGASKGKERLKNALSPRILHPDIIAEIVAHLAGYQIPTRTYSVLFMGEQRDPGNSVSTSADEVSVDWRISDTELAAYSSMVRQLSERLTDVAEAASVTDTLTADWLWSGAHHSRTVSVGTDENDTLDTDLRLRGTDNVFVCDGSVIQEHSYANTGLTIASLALRLAATIKS